MDYEIKSIAVAMTKKLNDSETELEILRNIVNRFYSIIEIDFH